MRDDMDLLHGNAAIIAEFLGVNVRTVKRWKAGRVPLPVACRKLLALRFEGDVTALLGKDWEGFYFGRDGQLYIPSWKYGFNPYQIKGMFFQVQQVRALERELETMQADKLGREFVRQLVQAALAAEPLGEPIGLDKCRQCKYSDSGHE